MVSLWPLCQPEVFGLDVLNRRWRPDDAKASRVDLTTKIFLGFSTILSERWWQGAVDFAKQGFFAMAGILLEVGPREGCLRKNQVD